MHIGGDKNSNRHIASLYVDEISWLTEHIEKDFWISNDLKASFHVAKAVSKANQTLGLIRRTIGLLSADDRNTAVCGSQAICWSTEMWYVWHSYPKKDMQLLEELQHQATRNGS